MSGYDFLGDIAGDLLEAALNSNKKNKNAKNSMNLKEITKNITQNIKTSYNKDNKSKHDEDKSKINKTKEHQSEVAREVKIENKLKEKSISKNHEAGNELCNFIDDLNISGLEKAMVYSEVFKRPKSRVRRRRTRHGV